MVRICPSQGIHDTSESMSFLKVDPRKKQITLYDPPTCGPTMTGHRRAVVAVPKMFAFDSVFPQDASQVGPLIAGNEQNGVFKICTTHFTKHIDF